jgi:hypothetical protein
MPSKTKPTASPDHVETFLQQLDHPHKEAIGKLRLAIKGIDPRIAEEIKWNAPSFKLDEHFATFKLHPPKAIQIVLHTGAKPKTAQKTFSVNDAHGLLTWPAPDRCMLTLQSSAQAEELHDIVIAMIKEWVQQLEP